MAIAKVVYKENASATPEVWMDTTQKTVTAGTMLSGTTALKNDGAGITGDIASKSSSDLTASGATVTAPAGYYPNAASKAVASGSASTPATSITANPTISVNASGLITASVSGSKSVTPTVSAGYVSSGTAGTVSVSGSNTQQLSTQAGTTITPTESEQTAVTSGKFTTGAVKVGAISSTYVGSGITQRDSTNLTASEATVTAPAGYYAEAASKSVASGSAGTPTATKGTVSNHSISVTPSVTNTTGYITGSTINGTAVTIDVTELESGTKSITENGTGISVSGYSAVDVDVPSQVPTGVKYVYSDVDGIGAWDVSGFEKCSVDGAPLNDGHLRLWFYFPSDAIPYSTSFVFGFNRTAGSISIDWGDGSSPTEKTSSSFTEKISHTYTSAGLFVVDVTFISGNVQLYNTQGNWASYLVAFEAHALNPQVINNLMFPSISAFSVLKSAWFGDELTTVGLLKTCISLERIRLSPNTVNIIAEHFAGDSSLKTFVVPSSVSSIAKNAFKDCVSLEEIHLLPTTPPTLAANKQSYDSAFYNTPSDMVIYVPSGCLTAYQSATNWSTFASQMQEESL